MCAAKKGNKYAEGNEGGRPAMFKTPEELQSKIDEYFNGGANKRTIIVGLGTMELPCYTICGLAYFLGFESRQSLFDYEKKEEFTYIIKKARLRIEMSYEERLQDNDETEKDTAQYREETLYFSKMLFKYIDENTYTEEDKFIFRCYYLMPKRFTYAKLNVMTGIDKSKCTRIIKAIKKDLRENFLLWLKEKNNMII